jgi:glycerate-2-kinase
MKGVNREIEETPKPGNQVFRNVHNIIIGSNVMAGKAAVEKAISMGYNSQLLSTNIEGEAIDVGSQLAKVAMGILNKGTPVLPPAAVVFGGETTVTVRGSGIGGRNLEVALSAARDIQGLNAVIATLATDGIDGPTNAAGAVVDGSTIDRAESIGLDTYASLKDNDSYSFFSSLKDALLTGPTGTNVNDIMLILVGQN